MPQADIVGLIEKAYFSLEASSGSVVSASQALADAFVSFSVSVFSFDCAKVVMRCLTLCNQVRQLVLQVSAIYHLHLSGALIHALRCLP